MKYDRTPMKRRDRTASDAPRDRSRTDRARRETITRKQLRALKRARMEG
jgi:hypothetical protein